MHAYTSILQMFTPAKIQLEPMIMQCIGVLASMRLEHCCVLQLVSEPQSELCTELVRESASWLLRPSSVSSMATDNLAHTDHMFVFALTKTGITAAAGWTELAAT